MGEQVKPTEEVKRYDFWTGMEGEINETGIGDWVRYDDHLAALASARAEVEALRKERNALAAFADIGRRVIASSEEHMRGTDCVWLPNDVSVSFATWDAAMAAYVAEIDAAIDEERAAREPGRSES